MLLKLEARTRISKDGRVVIPAAFRKALGINWGDVIVLRIEDDELLIETLKQRIARAQRHARKHIKPGSLIDEFLAERRAEAAKELD